MSGTALPYKQQQQTSQGCANRVTGVVDELVELIGKGASNE